jgi:hypothetical protein
VEIRARQGDYVASGYFDDHEAAAHAAAALSGRGTTVQKGAA